ncbi:hypothetical protein RUM43_014626 [Polyplax serrata]|uniref:Cyclin E n=1 Tax=Polyplax serrata TaxID=468196 RepID=A0AAN8S9J0_POLSC
MHRQSGCNSRTSGVKRKRQTLESEDQENISCPKQYGHIDKKAMYKPSSRVEYLEQAPSSPLSSPLTPRDVFTDQSLNRILGEYNTTFQKSERNGYLPNLTWAKWEQLWSVMCLKDKELTSKRNPKLFEHSPGIKPRMRSILLDWITEVCEVYQMHRETYYLAVDYLDRYLSLQTGVVKSQLQLIASKVEEIYPPKLTEFAYVTDKACKAEQILDMELVILKTIDWNLASVTAYAWLNLYTQICNTSGSSSSTSSSANSSNSSNTNATNYSFVFPNHSIKEFLQSSQLLDLCVLDEGSLRFPYSILAASCIYLTSYTDQILRVSGLQWSDISECVEWMSAFAQAIKEEKSPNSPIRVQHVTGNTSEDAYQKQTHSVDLNLLSPLKIKKRVCRRSEAGDKAQLKLQSRVTDIGTPAHKAMVLLTPPSSSKKSPKSTTELICG